MKTTSSYANRITAIPVLLPSALAIAAALLLASTGANSQTAPQQASPSRNLPYVAVHNPEFIPVSAATFLQPGDRVIGVTIGKTAKAYPAAILAQHGLVEDDAPDGPIAITW